MVVGIFVLAPHIVAFFGDERYRPSIITLKIVSFNLIFISISNFLSYQINIPCNRERFNIIGSAISLGTSLIFIPVFVRIFYHNGAALSMLFSLLLQTIFLFFTSTNIGKDIVIDVKNLFYPFSSILMGMILFFIVNWFKTGNVIIELVFYIISGAGIYLAFLIIIRDKITLELLNLLIVLLSRKFKK